MNNPTSTSLNIRSDISSGTTRGPGLLYIFNHINFAEFNRLHIKEKIKLDNRIGTDCDVESLQKSFANYGVKNIVYNDLKYEEIQEEITKISTENFSNNSCLIIAVLTHGFQKNELAAADIIYDFDEIILKISTNVHLKSKPKIFLLQACRGDIDIVKKLRAMRLMTDGPQISKHELPYYFNDEQYILHSATEAFAAYRKVTGSPFIQKFCEILNLYGHYKDVTDLFHLVKIEVKNQTSGLQKPEIQSNAVIPYVFGHYCHGTAAPLLRLPVSAVQNDGISSSVPVEMQKIYEPGFAEDIKNTENGSVSNFFNNIGWANFQNEYEFTSSDTPTEEDHTDKWVKFCPHHIPDNTVEAGIDLDGSKLHVGRAFYQDDLLPGKVFLNRSLIAISYNFQEWGLKQFEILTGNCYCWVKPERLGTVPSNAVQGGYTKNGEILYIGRSYHDGSWTPGKIQLSESCLYIPFGGREYKLLNYEVLVRSS